MYGETRGGVHQHAPAVSGTSPEVLARNRSPLSGRAAHETRT
jgi:hypothetical protein